VTVVLAPLVQRRSPNQSSRHGQTMTHLVWHATAGSYAGSVAWLCQPAADASAHLVIREDGGEVTQLVHLDAKAWHAVAANGYSVGVEHASPGAGFDSHAQLLESARVFGWLCHHLGIPPVFGLHKPRGIVRHRDLGLGGGGHSDGPPDSQWFGVFLPAVQHEVGRGGFRKTWAL
jgi:N-acetyl-anhydromuramyl-L-alanine amidase AmpD